MSLYDIYQHSLPNFRSFMDEDEDIFASTPFSSTDPHSPDISSSLQFLETVFSAEFQADVDAFDIIPILSNERKWSPGDESHRWNSNFAMNTCKTSSMNFDELNDLMESFEVAHESKETSHFQNSPRDAWNSGEDLPFEGMKIDNQLCLSHLFMAYAEAMENHHTDLAEVVAQRIVQKVVPTGGAAERVLYYMFQHLNNQSSYLTQESIKNYYNAFKAIYQIFPYGMLIHLLANLAILESLPCDVDIVHLIDFDTGEGIQWGSLMDTIKHQGKEIRLTLVKFDEEDERWKFEETKRRFLDQARSCGLKVKVEEVGLIDLEMELTNMKRRDNKRKSWYVFSCNVGLLHMGRVRGKKDVFEFMRLANKFLSNVTCCNKGMIAYGDGDVRCDTTSLSSYKTFLDRNFEHYRTLLESMEFDFPNHLGEARTMMECLFVAPYVSSIELDRKWEERKQYGDVRFEVGIEGWCFSEESLVEAKEIVKGRNSFYGVRMEGEKNNEIVMEWNGVPMMRLSCWRN